ncbi:MAG: GerMN domain-containing protein [Spirochaetaceae bacterium]|jgi:hypothetical protein|nr:GerMN domain-containing protein [Spirochaetaceae bacterium]
MAAQKRGNGGKKLSITVVFWMLFIVVIAFFFIANLPKITANLQKTRFGDRLFNKPVEATDAGQELFFSNPADTPEEGVAQTPAFPETGIKPALPFDPAFPFGTDNSADLQQTPPLPALAAGQEKTPAVQPLPVSPNIRERTLWFVVVDGGGGIFLKPVKRSLPAAAAPLVEVITSLLTGPDSAESASGLTTLIPPGAKLINARIQGNTAILNFNESFLFNSYDAEGYYAQLRQIVWTATEFPNVRNVQILIENRKVEFLGLTLRIDKPWSRETL